MDSKAGVRVLIVDDEPAVRESLTNSLVFEGYEVITAGDGIEALGRVDEAERGRERARPVVLGRVMPRLDGLTTCRRLRARGDTTPVLMLTARDMVGDRVTGLDAGADDYLVKPFELDELLARIRALLRRSTLTGAPAAEGTGDGVLVFD